METLGNQYIVREHELIHQDLSTYLKRHEQKEMLRLLVAGSVDDGKSTLIGRLLFDSHLIYKDHLEAITQDSKVFNTTENELDLSLLTDGLKAEREQGITIDVAYRYFSTEKKSFILCDAPGHEQYTRNMATGASHCDMALILIDAANGVKDQTRRHSLIASIMGIRNFVVVVNKMDTVEFKESVFDTIRQDYVSFSRKLDLDAVHFIPISALTGENVVTGGTAMPWFKSGPLLNFLENVPLINDRNLIDFRFPVQNVIRPNSSFRGYAGTVVSGIVRVGDDVLVLPSRKRTSIKSIETFDGRLTEAYAPMPVVLTMQDEVDISRGMVLTKPNNIPSMGRALECMMVWMEENPLMVGQTYLLKCNTQTVPARVKSVRYKYNINELTRLTSSCLGLNDIGRVELVLDRPLIFDTFRRNKSMGAFVLIDRNSHATGGGGVVLDQVVEGTPEKRYLFREESAVSMEDRILWMGHKPATIWLTGLSGSGKSTIAKILETELINQNVHVCVLDGDNLRHGLTSDLGFSPEDRCENIRRTAEVAKLMNNAGLVVIAAFVSPFRKDREMAADIVGVNFQEVFVDAGIETCRKRDPKGLYAKFDAGKFSGLTGVDAPYEVPESPSLRLDTNTESVAASVEKVLDMIVRTIKI